MKQHILDQILKEKLKDRPNQYVIQQLQQLLDQYDKD
jgi:hypothetical protein